jgi:hypothetical protein
MTQVEGYSVKNVAFTFVPMKTGPIFQEATIFFDNQEFTEPIKIVIKGECVNVPVYVDKLVYDLNILVYDKTFREKIIIHNRGTNTMKIQLYFPSDLKNYIEFNPTLGYIQGNDKFDIWMKFKPDRTILNVAKKYISFVKEIEGYSTPEINIPIKIIGANQVLPILFTIRSRFTVESVTFSPPILSFGNIYDLGAARVNGFIENHSVLPLKFCFMSLPEEIEVETDKGCGVIYPGEKYAISYVYRP